MELNVAELKRLMEERRITQAELARRSGISRVRLNALLQDEKATIRPETERRLSKALGLQTGALDREGTQKKYMEAVRKQHGTLDLTGMGIVVTRDPIPIDRVFAEVSLRERQCEEYCGQRAEEEADPTPATRRKPTALSLAGVLARSRKLFLLGEPGAGKTTILRHLAFTYASLGDQHGAYPAKPSIPVLVRLAYWGQQLEADKNLDAISAAVAQLEVQEPGETAIWLAKEAAAGNVLLLLDGLDEVADPEQRGWVIEMLRSFIATCPKCSAIVSSRRVGFEPPKLTGFDFWELQGLSDPSIRNFITAWCAFRHDHQAKTDCKRCSEEAKKLSHAINNPRVKPLAGNPMMLTMLLLLHEANVALPQRRCELYGKLAEAFVFSWQEKKRAALSGSPTALLRVDDRDLVWILESLALEMQKNDMTLVRHWWLTGHVRNFLHSELGFKADIAAQEADDLLWSLQERSGLIAERGPGRFGFRHLAFQEYFAARAVLASDDPVQSLRPFLYHPRWREVVRLAAAQLDRRRAPQLLRLILDDPDPTGRFLARGLLLVLQCLADGAPPSDPDLLSDLTVHIRQLGASKWLGIALDAIGILKEMIGTRLEAFARDAVDGLLRTAGESLDETDFVLLGLRALDAGFRVGNRETEACESAEAAKGTKPVAEIKAGKASFVVVRPPDGDRKAWLEAVIDQLLHDSSARIRAHCAKELRRFAASKTNVRTKLLAALKRENEPWVRAEVAESLSSASNFTEVFQALRNGLLRDCSPKVRSACASALRVVARSNHEVRQELMHLFEPDGPSTVRQGTVRGLSCSAESDPAIRDLLWSKLIDATEDEGVRVECLYALEDRLPEMPSALCELCALLTSSTQRRLSRSAALVLAEYAYDGKVEWSAIPIEQIEHVLVSVTQPCCHVLDALRRLVDARELRGHGVPREARIKAALSDFSSRIRCMFIFGSAARQEQRAESDVDLMIIGDVSLRELSPHLKRAEQELGRQVNPVIYSQAEWSERLRTRNPFVTQVMKGEKIFIIGEPDELAAMAG